MFFTKRTQFILYFPTLFWARLKFNHESLPCLEPKPCPERSRMDAYGSMRAILGAPTRRYGSRSAPVPCPQSASARFRSALARPGADRTDRDDGRGANRRGAHVATSPEALQRRWMRAGRK